MIYFVGILDGGEDNWGVRIPDIDGCIGAGPSPEAAIADVTTALRDVMSYKRSGGFALPQPSSLVAVLAGGF